MKIKPTRSINLIDKGKDNWEKIDEFNRKVNEIKQELLDKYSPVLSTEKNWFKRQLIKIPLWLEMKKRVNDLSSWRNLHVTAH